MGVIVRTEAEGQSDADIQEDLEILLEKWNTIITAAETRPAPSLLYRDQDLLYRVMREACSEEVDEIVLDTSYGVHRTQQILQNWNMTKKIDVNVYKGSETLLVASGIVKEIKSALQTKVNLPSGGYLFVQTTEALTVIDVNSGKFVSSNTQDETILKTNLEAVHEIARQLRLRNIGGMVIVDFIDMTNRQDKLAIMEELEIALEKDKAKPQVGQLSDLGLVELTRHRQGQSLSELFSKKCPHCQGTGYIADDLTFSSPVLEGEIKAKAAKLKIPAQQIKNKTQNYKQNKVFNNQNNNPNNNQVQDVEQNNNQQNNQNNNHFNHQKKNHNKFNNRNNERNDKENVVLQEAIDSQNLVDETKNLLVQELVVEQPQVNEVETKIETKVEIMEESKEEQKEDKTSKKAKRTYNKKKTTKKSDVDNSKDTEVSVEKNVVSEIANDVQKSSEEKIEKKEEKPKRKPRKAKKETKKEESEQKVNE